MRDYVQPVSFQVPRKSDLFQEDLYPPTYAGVAGLEFDAYIAGENKDPVTTSMDPSQRDDTQAAAAVFVADKSPAELKAELEAANKRIAELEAALAAAQAK
eukprot:TRINITY_DN63998_c0_g1_i1.p1 TRINITY_DN63998_c0_g1~~TRINITY_DN63998_c0_g1_i1.p1  ORF type:complete len:114 (+),score=29.28 TRINITY_DN63998_c0_g1_i1:40-342(+)